MGEGRWGGRKKRYYLRRQEVKLSLFTDGMILYTESPEVSTQTIRSNKNLEYKGVFAKVRYMV